MSQEEEIDTEEFGNLKHVSFNQDGSQFVVLSKKGIHVFSINPSYGKKYDKRAKEVNLVEMNANYLAYVSKRKMQLYDVDKKSVICEIHETREILGLRFTKDHFVMIFEDEVDIYERDDKMDNKFWSVKTFPKNLGGVCASAVYGDIFAVPSEKIGEVLICDLLRKEIKNVAAHKNPIKCLALSPDGSFLATCSDGKNIKLIDTKEGKIIRGYKRGMSAQEMYSIAFSRNSKELCCYSSSGTVHQFSLDEEGKNRTAALKPLSYLGISYFGSLWSKNEMSLKPSDPGICSFNPEDSNFVHIVTNSGGLISIDFSGEVKKYVENIYKELKPTMQVRRHESERILRRFPEIVPVMLDLKKNCTLPKLPKRKYLVPKGLSVGNFAFSIDKKMGLENTNLKFFVGKEEVYLSIVEDSLEAVYQKFQNPDGFLYLKYSD